MIHVGQKLPDFTLLLVFADGKKDIVSFHAFLQQARGPVILGFFPGAFQTIDGVQLTEFRDRQAVFDHVNARAVGFSVDTPAVNAQFAKVHQLKFGLFCDPNFRVVDALWQTATVAGVERRAKRGWMLVGQDGTLLEKWVAEDPTRWSGVEPINAAIHKHVPHEH